MKLPRTRAAREAVVILGRAAVEYALTHRDEVACYMVAHPGEVEDAARAILAFLPDDVAGAVAFAAELAPEMRAAIAGGWVDGAGQRAIYKLGLEERP